MKFNYFFLEIKKLIMLVRKITNNLSTIQYENKSIYQGYTSIIEGNDINNSEKIVPNGYGKYFYESGDKYLSYNGDWKLGIKEGNGTFEKNYENYKEYYSGDFKNDLFHGNGILKTTNNNITTIYEGKFFNGHKHGEGYEYKEGSNLKHKLIYNMGFTKSMREYTTNIDSFTLNAYKINNNILGPSKITNKYNEIIYEGDYNNGIVGSGKLSAFDEIYEGTWKKLVSNKLYIFDGNITINKLTCDNLYKLINPFKNILASRLLLKNNIEVIVGTFLISLSNKFKPSILKIKHLNIHSKKANNFTIKHFSNEKLDKSFDLFCNELKNKLDNKIINTVISDMINKISINDLDKTVISNLCESTDSSDFSDSDSDSNSESSDITDSTNEPCSCGNCRKKNPRSSEYNNIQSYFYDYILKLYNLSTNEIYNELKFFDVKKIGTELCKKFFNNDKIYSKLIFFKNNKKHELFSFSEKENNLFFGNIYEKYNDKYYLYQTGFFDFLSVPTLFLINFNLKYREDTNVPINEIYHVLFKTDRVKDFELIFKESDNITDRNFLEYFGETKDGDRNGKGKNYYENGNLKYEGDFRYHLYSGEGTLYDDNGNVIYAGRFREGAPDF